jgi:hypothetical protein
MLGKQGLCAGNIYNIILETEITYPVFYIFINQSIFIFTSLVYPVLSLKVSDKGRFKHRNDKYSIRIQQGKE